MKSVEISLPRYEFDDGLIAAALRTGDAAVAVYRPACSMAVLGRGSRIDRELHLSACQADAVPLYRRMGGGCAVWLDPGNLIVSAAVPLPGLGGIQESTARLTAWMITGLARAGHRGVTSDGFSDLVLNDRKIGGSCIYRRKGLLLYTTTLLFAPDLEAVERYLPHPPREPEYRRGRGHRAFMGSLAGRATGEAGGGGAAGEAMARARDDLWASLPALAIDGGGLRFA